MAPGVGDSKTLQVYLLEMVLFNMKYLLRAGFSFKYSWSLKWLVFFSTLPLLNRSVLLFELSVCVRHFFEKFEDIYLSKGDI